MIKSANLPIYGNFCPYYVECNSKYRLDCEMETLAMLAALPFLYALPEHTSLNMDSMTLVFFRKHQAWNETKAMEASKMVFAYMVFYLVTLFW